MAPNVSEICKIPTLLHGFTGTGFLHPLTGLDHMLAMVTVGAWSAQLGGRNLLWVPLAFLVMMCTGGVLGMRAVTIHYTELGIVLSVVLLGAAVALKQRVATALAVLAIGIFGLCHGYEHGREITREDHVPFYIIGFLVTTLGLHVVGAVGGLLLLEHKRGNVYLRLAGAVVSLIGVTLLVSMRVSW